MPKLHPGIVELANREAIRDCICRSALGNDMCHADLWKSTYWPDAYENHLPMFEGNAHEFIDVAISSITERMHMSFHKVGVPLIRIEGRLAKAVTYASIYCRLKSGSKGAPADLAAGVRYLDTFEKRGGEWRILRRVTHTDWRRETQDPPGFAPVGDPSVGARSATDPVRALFGHDLANILRPQGQSSADPHALAGTVLSG